MSRCCGKGNGRQPCVAYIYSDWNEIRNPLGLGCTDCSNYQVIPLSTETACGKCCKNLCPSTCCEEVSTSYRCCPGTSSKCCSSTSVRPCPANCRRQCCRPRKIIINVKCKGDCKKTTSRKTTSKQRTKS